MRITGSEVVPAPRPRVWRLLQDPEVLRRTVPGCQSFEPRGEGTYAAAIVAGVGPIRGRFTGTVTLKDHREPEAYTMALEGQGPTGFVRGEGHVTLTDEEGGTRVQVEGEAQVGGTLAQVGSRMIETAVRMLMSQFFNALSQEAKRAEGAL